MSTIEAEVEAARRRVVAWLEWYRNMHVDASGEPMTKQALARALGIKITRSAVSQLLNPNTRRAPDFATLIATARLLGFGYEALLTKDPPALAPRRG